VPEGFAVYSFDHRGHGRSPGQRGHINDFAQFRGDVNAFLETVAAQEPERPLFLMGHSLGGLIVLDYVLHHPQGLQGVIASAPAVGEIAAAAQWCQAHAAELALPLLILHGDADRLTEPDGSRRFFDKVTHPHKERLVYQGGYHESHNDIHWQQVAIDLERWLVQHI
jgi:alpha-beta hydrolase superfamily lysophospholipase